MKFTIKHLLAVAKGYGYAGKEDDWQAMKTHLLAIKDDEGQPAPITEVKFGSGSESQIIDIKGLVFNEKPARPPSRIATLMADDDPEDSEIKLNAMLDERLKRLGFDPANGKRLPMRETVESVKSADERIYEDRIKSRTSAFKCYDHAYGFGSDIQVKGLRAMGKHQEAQELYAKVREQLEQKGYTLVTTASGSALAPEGYDSDLHQFILQYGVGRRAARVVNMNAETVVRPKATGDLTVYYPADGSAGTESTKTWSNVQLRAKKGIVIVKTSKSLAQDSAINIGDDAARDIVRAIAKVEDRSLFNSDGSGVANNYMPNTQGILNIISETSTGARVYKSAQNNPLSITLADVIALMATPANFVGKMMAFHCTSQISAAILQRLGASVGGIGSKEIQGFGNVTTFLGSPVIHNEVMTTNLGTGSNRQLLVYGDISLAADFGDRLGLSVEISDQRYWDEDNLGIKGTVRHDLNVHGLGASTDSGPLAVLIQA